MPPSDLDRIDPDSSLVTLTSGTEVQITRLRTRQFFRLLKVLTHGGGEMLVRTLDFNAPGDEFAQRLAMAILFSIPDAEQEAVLFVQSMCLPVGVAPPEVRRKTKQQREDDDAAFTALAEELFNPPLDDTVTIVEAVIRQEAGDIQALGKRLAGLLNLADRTGQLKPGTPEKTPGPEEMADHSPAATPSSSTSSAPSTDGPTNGSSAPGSAASGRSRRSSPAAASGS
jgi:hypothetical protein